MNRPILSIKKTQPTTVTSSPVLSSTITRRRKREILVSDLRKEEAIAPLRAVDPPPPPPPPKPKAPPPVKSVESKKEPKKKVKPEPVRPREERIAECLVDLQATWPLLFNAEQIVLWEVGIRKKLWRGMNKKHSRTLISHALARWQEQHPDYWELLKTAGHPRYGLDGAVTMQVTEEQAQQAIARME